MKILSIIVPCYNEEESLPIFSEEYGSKKRPSYIIKETNIKNKSLQNSG